MLSAQASRRWPPAGMTQAGAACRSASVGCSWYANSCRTEIHNSMKMARNSRTLMWSWLGSMSDSWKLLVLFHPMFLGNPAACKSCKEMRHMWFKKFRSDQPPSALVDASVDVMIVLSRGMSRPMGRFQVLSCRSSVMRARKRASSSRMDLGKEDLWRRYHRRWRL